MAPDTPPSSFGRFERTRDRLGANARVARLERWTSPHTHPGLSVMRVTITKLRVLGMFVIRRLAQGTGRRRALAELRELAGSARGKRILVIGSGPSAGKLSGAAIARAQRNNELIVIATNNFLLSPLAKKVSPDFLLWSDAIFAPHSTGHQREVWEILAKHPEVHLVCPWTWKSGVEQMSLPRPAFYFDDETLEGWTRNISPLRPRGYQGTTGVKAIALAAHFAPQQIDIIGIDLSYFKNFRVDAENHLTQMPAHLTGTDWGAQTLDQYAMFGVSDLLYSMASQFRALHTHFRGLPIVNLDGESLVDAFPKNPESELLLQRYLAK